MKKNKINDICFKLYAPHLCAEPVTENKSALETKLWGQLEKYGFYILKFRTDSDKYYEEKSMAVVEAVVNCIQMWKKKEITAEENFLAYFSSALRREYIKIIKKEEKHQKFCSSLDVPVGEGDDTLLRDLMPDEKSLSPEEICENKERSDLVLQYLDVLWKQAGFPDWYRIVLTGKMYSEFHEIFIGYPDKRLERYSFIDKEIYNLENKPKDKELAEMIGKDATQLSRALRKIRKKLQSLGLESPL